MAIGQSRRIVIDVDKIELKRNLYSALAQDGRSLKEWFVEAAGKYLDGRMRYRQLNLSPFQVAEQVADYGKKESAPTDTGESDQ